MINRVNSPPLPSPPLSKRAVTGSELWIIYSSRGAIKYRYTIRKLCNVSQWAIMLKKNWFAQRNTSIRWQVYKGLFWKKKVQKSAYLSLRLKCAESLHIWVTIYKLPCHGNLEFPKLPRQNPFRVLPGPKCTVWNPRGDGLQVDPILGPSGKGLGSAGETPLLVPLPMSLAWSANGLSSQVCHCASKENTPNTKWTRSLTHGNVTST